MDEVQQEDRAAVSADRTKRTETADIVPSAAPTTSRDAEEDDLNLEGVPGAGITSARAGAVVIAIVSRSGGGYKRCLAHLTNAQVVVDRATRVAINCALGRASMELVRLDVYIALLNKWKDCLDLKYSDLEVTRTTWRRQRTGMENSNALFVLNGARTRRLLCTNVVDIFAMFKHKGVRLTFLPCFKEVYSSMFHLANRVTTEKHGKSSSVKRGQY